MITPAISVLSAIEGLQIATPIFRPYVVPVAGLVLVVLFAIQRRGSGRGGRLFGPVMGAGVGGLGLAGAPQGLAPPGGLASAGPRYALPFLRAAGSLVCFPVVGLVFFG